MQAEGELTARPAVPSLAASFFSSLSPRSRAPQYSAASSGRLALLYTGRLFRLRRPCVGGQVGLTGWTSWAPATPVRGPLPAPRPGTGWAAASLGTEGPSVAGGLWGGTLSQPRPAPSGGLSRVSGAPAATGGSGALDLGTCHTCKINSRFQRLCRKRECRTQILASIDKTSWRVAAWLTPRARKARGVCSAPSPLFTEKVCQAWKEARPGQAARATERRGGDTRRASVGALSVCFWYHGPRPLCFTAQPHAHSGGLRRKPGLRPWPLQGRLHGGPRPRALTRPPPGC